MVETLEGPDELLQILSGSFVEFVEIEHPSPGDGSRPMGYSGRIDDVVVGDHQQPPTIEISKCRTEVLNQIGAFRATAIGQDYPAVFEVVDVQFRWDLRFGLSPVRQTRQMRSRRRRPAVVDRMGLIDGFEVEVALIREGESRRRGLKKDNADDYGENQDGATCEQCGPPPGDTTLGGSLAGGFRSPFSFQGPTPCSCHSLLLIVSG